MKRLTFRLLFAFALLFSLSMLLSACNTVEGIGRDLESAGDSTADAASDDDDESSDE